jgi:beta-galactosidase GanA
LICAGLAAAPVLVAAGSAVADTASSTCPATTPSAASGSLGAPTNVRAIAGSGSATVTWCPPAGGQSKVTSYTVTASNGATGTAEVPEDFFIMDGLTNGQSYTFTVAANTSSGSGPSSTASNTVTADPIPQPSGVVTGTPEPVTYDQHSVMVGGQRVFLYAAEFDPWRLPSPSLWLDRLEKVKAAGYNAVTMYFDWAYSSPSAGVYDFTGVRDINALLNMAQQVGLYVIARPGPYINAETNGGGIPAWVLTMPNAQRSDTEPYLSAARQWLSEVDPIIAAHQVTKGGDVVLDQIENEYTSSGTDADNYMADLETQAKSDGINVPFSFNFYCCGTFSSGTGAVNISGLDSYPLGFNCASTGAFGNPGTFPAFTGEPATSPEFQGGSIDEWGGAGAADCYTMTGSNFEDVYYKNNIAQGLTIQSNYMGVGGTDWGWLPDPDVYTSYDYGAGIQETGEIGTWANPSGVTTTPSTGPGGLPTGYNALELAGDGLCLDGYGNSSNAGAIIDQWTCNGGTNQDIQFVPVSGGYGALQIENSGQYVTVSGSATAAGTPDIVQEPTDSSSASLWKPIQQSDGSFEFQNEGSGLCLDDYGASTTTGQQFDQWTCKNAPGTNQDFQVAAAPNMTEGSKVGMNKLIGDFIQASPSLTMTDAASAPSVSNSNVTALARTNSSTGEEFIYLRQSTASNTGTVSTTMSLPGFSTVPQQGSISIAGRSSDLLVYNDVFAGQNLVYSTSQLMTQGSADGHSIVLMYGTSGTGGETVLNYTSQPTVNVLSGNVTTTWTGSNDDLRLDYTHSGLAEVSISGGGRPPLLLLLADTLTAENFWPESTSSGYALVEGSYLVRTAQQSGSALQLTGDTSQAGPITVWAPSGTGTITWNGGTLSTTTNADGSFTANLAGPAAVSLPTLSNWKFSAEAPEAQNSYNDSSWTLADDTSTTTGASGTPVLSASDYGYYNGFVWYRGHFTATGSETGVSVTGLAGDHVGAFSVWLNGTFLGSNSSGGKQTQAFSFPSGTVKAGQTNVVAVLMEDTGHPEGPSTEPTGLYSASLQGSSAPITWYLHGGTANSDTVRGPMNVGGLYGTDNGWDLPGYPTSSWQSVSLPDSWSSRSLPPGIGWYDTTFNLSLASSSYVPIDVEINGAGPGAGNENMRAFIFINGWMIGQYIDNVGPQHQFYVPAGILNDNGANTIAIAVWALNGTSESLGSVSLVAEGNQAGGVPVAAVDSPGYTGGSGYPIGYHALTVGSDGLCLDNSGGTTNAGAAIDQWNCNGGGNQQFQFVPTSGGYGELEVDDSGQDLTVSADSTAQGTPDIVQQPASGDAAAQWLPEAQSDGSYQFVNKNSGLCLDAYGGSSQGQQLDQWPCKNAPGTNQDFTAQ